MVAGGCCWLLVQNWLQSDIQCCLLPSSDCFYHYLVGMVSSYMEDNKQDNQATEQVAVKL